MSSQSQEAATTQSTTASSKSSSESSQTATQGPVSPRRSGELVTPQGRTSIADGVVAKVVGVATREVSGVYAMGAGTARTFGALRERTPGSRTNYTQGVAVEVGERQAAVDLDVVVEYGTSIPDLATAIRRNVITAVERMCGLEASEVNISVDDIHLPEDSEQPPESGESRVQ